MEIQRPLPVKCFSNGKPIGYSPIRYIYSQPVTIIHIHGLLKKAGTDMAFSYLSDLKGDAENWMIRVRICRMWESISSKDNSLLSLDMILIDEKENLMHAAVRKHLVSRFRDRMTEGLVYNLRNVKIATNIYPYRPLASNLRLLFLATTNVEAVGEGVACIPRYGFQFVNQAALRSRADDVTTLSDIVGCFCGFGEVEVVGAGFRKRDIRIFTDYSITSTVTLWGKLGEEFDPALYTQDGGPYVMVISFVTVKTFQGALTFATTSGSRVYVNPDIDHVSSIRERFSALPPKVVSIEGTASAKLPPEEAMFVNRMTVEDLVNATCDGKLKVDVVTLKATITAINNHNGWFYVSCKSCVKKAVPKDGVYVCTGCGEAVDYPLAMFRVNVQVADNTGSTTVVLFNAVTERMLDVSAKKLIKKCLQDYGVSAVYTPVGELEGAHAKNVLAAAGVDLVESTTADDDNVPESDPKRKRKLSSVIEDVSGSGSGTA